MLTVQFGSTRGFVLALLLGAGPVGAQSVYRCGTDYRDRPCEAEVQQRLSPTTGRPTGESFNPRSSIECARQGMSAKSITEKRRAGLTLDDALAAVRLPGLTPAQKYAREEFVRTVYRYDDPPAVVARKIEDLCVAQWPTASDYRMLATTQTRQTGPNAAAAAAAMAAADAIRQANEPRNRPLP